MKYFAALLTNKSYLRHIAERYAGEFAQIDEALASDASDSTFAELLNDALLDRRFPNIRFTHEEHIGRKLIIAACGGEKHHLPDTPENLADCGFGA